MINVKKSQKVEGEIKELNLKKIGVINVQKDISYFSRISRR